MKKIKVSVIGSGHLGSIHTRLWKSTPNSELLGIFFFQAEDGIRDLIVTGVQTCALPIWSWCPKEAKPEQRSFQQREAAWKRGGRRCQTRSEERRVGKEGRSRESPYH